MAFEYRGDLVQHINNITAKRKKASNLENACATASLINFHNACNGLPKPICAFRKGQNGNFDTIFVDIIRN